MREYTVDQLFYSGWLQLNRKQIIKVILLSEALMKYERGSKECGLLMIELLLTLRKNKRAFASLTVDQKVDCFNEIAFFQRKEDGSFKTPWLFFPVSNFRTKGQSFSRPEMNGTLPMYNRSFAQLCFADAAFSAFCLFQYKLNSEILTTVERKQLEADMDDSLNSLVAVLYTEPGQFDEKDIDSRTRLIPLKVSAEDKALILHTYANVRTFITDREAALFPKKEESKERTIPQFTGEMWMNLRFDLAKTEVFKGFSAASNARIYDALDFLDKETREAKERKPNDQA